MNHLWTATALMGLGEGKGWLRSGEYYEPVGVGRKASVFGKDDALAGRLWEWTEKELEGHVL